MDKVVSSRIDEGVARQIDWLARTLKTSKKQVLETAEWHRTHGVDLHDALLAATALRSGGRIYTLNPRHYPMPEVPVARAWPEE